MLTTLLLLLSVQISGFVRNASDSKGIEGIVVTDGYTSVATDITGRYELDADSLARTISICVPANYEIPIGKDGRPRFFRYIGTEVCDFTLEPRRNACERFTVLAVADAHIRDAAGLKRLSRESIPDIRRTAGQHKNEHPVIGIGMGDQLWDVMGCADDVKKQFSRLSPVPFFYCIGNHDHNNAGGKNEYAVTDFFIRNFGPTDYSFDMGKAHIIVMDDIQHTGTQKDGIKISYKTGITDRQLKWLKEDLSLVSGKKDKLVIFCCHAPLFGRFSHKDEIKALLSEFSEAHILSGHEHNINNVFHSDKIWEHNIQSLSGAWWYSNLSPNGSPLGYAVLTFDGPSLCDEYNKATTEAEDFQMRVYNGNDAYNEMTPRSNVKSKPKRDRVYGWPEEMKGRFIVRLWDGTKDWEVKFIYKGEEYPMEQTRTKFFDAATCAFMVDIFGGPFGGSTPYKAQVDSFWTIDAPGGDPSTLEDWEIVATHKLPSGKTRIYKANKLMRDYQGFATGTHYER